MNDRALHIADSLKSAYIDFVLNTFDDDVVIGHEVMYGTCGRFADLVLLYKGYTYAIEIKSDSDSLYRIDGQVQEYQKQFNYVIVVCGPKFISRLKHRLPKGVGLYKVDNDSSVKEVLKPHRKLRLDKNEMLFSVKTSYLTKHAGFPTAHMGADAIRQKLTKKRISDVQEILYGYWRSKMTPAFECFMSDRGCQTIPIDLSNFSTYRVMPAF